MKFSNRLFENLKVYLRKSNWKSFQTNYSGLNAFLNEEFEKVKIILPVEYDFPGIDQRIDAAIKTLTAIKNENEKLFTKALLEFDSDLHNYRVPGENLSAVSLYLAEEIITSMRKLIQSSAQSEYNKFREQFKKDKKTMSQVSTEYVNSCRFGHTWEGSFGFTIETPINLKSIGLFEEESPKYERKISEKIYSGMKIIHEADRLNTPNYIVDQSENGFNAKMLKQVLEIGNYVNYSTIEYSTTWSPALIVNKSFEEQKSFQMNSKTFSLVEKAITQMKDDDDTYEITFIGFPKGFSADKELLLDREMIGKRLIKVDGVSDTINNAVLTFELGYIDYLKAVNAHENHKDVKIKCKVKKKSRGWEVLELLSFELGD